MSSQMQRPPTVSLSSFLAILFALLTASCAHTVSEEEQTLLKTAAGIGPGLRVADVGAGDGILTVALARMVGPSGRVFATEIDPDKLQATAERARRAGLANVKVAAASANATGLPEGCCDAVILRSVYHHLPRPSETLVQLHAALKPGGRLVIVDFLPSALLAPWTPEGTPTEGDGHGATPAAVRRTAEAAGFVHLRTVQPWPGRWLDFFGVVMQRAP